MIEANVQHLQDALLTGSCVSRVADEEKLERHELYESKRIAKAMLSYLARNHHLVGPLYDLLDIFTVHSRVDFSFLQTYFRETVAKSYSLEDKRKVRALCARVQTARCVRLFAASIESAALHLIRGMPGGWRLMSCRTVCYIMGPKMKQSWLVNDNVMPAIITTALPCRSCMSSWTPSRSSRGRSSSWCRQPAF